MDVGKEDVLFFEHYIYIYIYIFLKLGILLFAYYVKYTCPVKLRAVSFTIQKS